MNHKIALIFPGQGSQSLGMGRSVYEEFPIAKDIADNTDSLLGYSLTDIMFHGPLETLNQTYYTQPAILLTSLMLLKALESFYGSSFYDNVTCVAGHSVGEYAAIAASGSLSFESALHLIQVRAEAMEKASPKDEKNAPKGAMCALIAIDYNRLKEIIDENFKNEPKRCTIANDNCPGQIVITGLKEDVEKIRDIALERGAKKGILLPVSGPFHSPWMIHASKILQKKLEEITFEDCKIPLISNVTADIVTQAEDLKNLIPVQVSSPLRWRESMQKMLDIGINTFIEIGNGQVLTHISKRCAPHAAFLSIQTAEDARSLENRLLEF